MHAPDTCPVCRGAAARAPAAVGGASFCLHTPFQFAMTVHLGAEQKCTATCSSYCPWRGGKRGPLCWSAAPQWGTMRHKPSTRELDSSPCRYRQNLYKTCVAIWMGPGLCLHAERGNPTFPGRQALGFAFPRFFRAPAGRLSPGPHARPGSEGPPARRAAPSLTVDNSVKAQVQRQGHPSQWCSV